MIDQPVEEQPYQTYWVHPDHLGSGSVITNQAGATTNWYEYMPFGEMLMEQSNYEYNNLYKYNGKELDEATGLYYYGARYYDPKTSVWLSVDPLAVYNPVMETASYLERIMAIKYERLNNLLTSWIRLIKVYLLLAHLINLLRPWLYQ